MLACKYSKCNWNNCLPKICEINASFFGIMKISFGIFRKKQPSGSPYHTIMPVDSHSTGGQSWNFIAQWKQLRSNSWSDSLDDCRIVPALDLNRWFFFIHFIVSNGCKWFFICHVSLHKIDHYSVIHIHNVNCTTATSVCMLRCYFVGICWCRVPKSWNT